MSAQKSGSVMICFLVLSALPALISGKCSVNLDSRSGKYPPLLLKEGSFLYPSSEENDERILSFEEDEEIELYCHGSEKYQYKTFVNGTSQASLPLTCKSGDFMDSSYTFVVPENSTCNRAQEPRLVREKKECSPVGADGKTGNDLVQVSIGWQLGDKFVEQVGVCVDESEFGTIWTKHVVHGANIEFRDKDPKRPSFKTDTRGQKRFFNWTSSWRMGKMYSKKSQAATITDLLDGVKEINGEVIIETGSSGTDYFAKGHLSPDAAFITNAEQDATYYFINVAPQFQSFNNGNWKALEGAVRDFAAKLKRDLNVITGTHNILEYPDKNNNMDKIFLFNATSVPAPQYYWKVVEDPKTKRAAVFIGLNDPHVDVAPKELCENRCGEMSSWVDWSLTKLDSGYMYCCTVEEASKVIKEIPKMSASGGLLTDSDEAETGTGTSCQTGPCKCSCIKKASFTCTCTCDDGDTVTNTK